MFTLGYLGSGTNILPARSSGEATFGAFGHLADEGTVPQFGLSGPD